MNKRNCQNEYKYSKVRLTAKIFHWSCLERRMACKNRDICNNMITETFNWGGKKLAH
jgi:hypothetical protein